MKFFVDTADVAEIKELAATGLLDGVTTNPSLVAKAKRDFKEIIAEICAAISGPVSAEVAATDLDGMLKEGRTLARIAKNVTVKVPLTWDGLKACRTLSCEGIIAPSVSATADATGNRPAVHAVELTPPGAGFNQNLLTRLAASDRPAHIPWPTRR